jgi:hypothetical protein
MKQTTSGDKAALESALEASNQALIAARKELDNHLEAAAFALQRKQQAIDRLTATLEKYDAAAKKFIAKVDNGRASSVETYRDLKEALNRPDAEEV